VGTCAARGLKYGAHVALRAAEKGRQEQRAGDTEHGERGVPKHRREQVALAAPGRTADWVGSGMLLSTEHARGGGKKYIVSVMLIQNGSKSKVVPSVYIYIYIYIYISFLFFCSLSFLTKHTAGLANAEPAHRRAAKHGPENGLFELAPRVGVPAREAA
jgi:hypothetical protein